ncbi:MAG: hypothetical protein ACRYG5_06655 [Janthinobacterium lividum]
MKKTFMLLIAAGFATFVLAACGTAGQTSAQASIARVCVPTQAALTALQGIPTLPASDQLTLSTKVTPTVTAMCAAGAALNVTTLNTALTTALPAINTIIQASTLSDAQKTSIGLDIVGAEFVLATIIGSITPTAPAVPASAPAAASAVIVA